MLAKLSALISSKLAIAVIGTVVVVGGGTTAAVVATGHVPSQLAVFSDSSHSDNGGTSTDKDASHGTTRTVAIQGTLSHYTASSSGASGVSAVISVNGKAEQEDADGSDNDNDAANSNTNTTNNDSDNDDSQQNKQPSSTATASNGNNTGEHDGENTGGRTATPTSTTKTTTTCTLTSPFTVAIDGNTKFNGQAKSASDLANLSGHTVEIQAAEDTSCRLLATKVTVAGATDDKKHVFVGTVGTVNTGASSFTLQPFHGEGDGSGNSSGDSNSSSSASAPLKVTVSAGTTFHGSVKGLSDLKPGMIVGIVGTLSGTTVGATDVIAQAPVQSDGGREQNNSSGVTGFITGVNGKTNSFTVDSDGHHSVTVSVNSATKYSGSVSGFGDLKQGMSVVVAGTPQSDGSLLAASVAADANSGD